MKRNYYLVLGVATLMLAATACGPRVRRYGCRGGGRCISSITKESKKVMKTLPTATFSSNSTIEKPA